MALETALIAGGIELIKFLIEKIFFAERSKDLDSGQKKHTHVKKAVMDRFTNEYIAQGVDILIEESVDTLNRCDALKKRGC